MSGEDFAIDFKAELEPKEGSARANFMVVFLYAEMARNQEPGIVKIRGTARGLL